MKKKTNYTGTEDSKRISPAQGGLRHKLRFLLCLLLALFLTGCVQDFDADRYVQASLDACIHGEYTDYMEVTHTSLEDAEKTHNSMLDQEVSYLETYHPGEETRQKFRELFDRAYKNYRYEVGEGVRQEDNSYIVPVTTYKLKLFRDIIADTRSYVDDFYHSDSDNADGTLSQQEFDDMITAYLYDYLEESLKEPEYEEGVTTNVEVFPAENNYNLSSEELQRLIMGLSDAERLSEQPDADK